MNDLKSLLRSQIRMKASDILPPDFVYLSVNKIQVLFILEGLILLRFGSTYIERYYIYIIYIYIYIMYIVDYIDYII